MLLAAAVLFYASYWLISKIEIVAWTRFVKGQIQRAAESGSAFALAGVAFLAVYREGFETVLSTRRSTYPARRPAARPRSRRDCSRASRSWSGVRRHRGVRTQGADAPFFAVTGATLAFLSFVFAGDGVKELQEGGYIASSLVHGGRATNSSASIRRGIARRAGSDPRRHSRRARRHVRDQAGPRVDWTPCDSLP